MVDITEFPIPTVVVNKTGYDQAVTLSATAVQPGDLATVATTGAYGDLSGLPTLGTAAATDATAYATAAQGALADTAVQPAAISDFVSGTGVTDIVALTQAEYDALTPDANTLYVITDA